MPALFCSHIPLLNDHRPSTPQSPDHLQHRQQPHALARMGTTCRNTCHVTRKRPERVEHDRIGLKVYTVFFHFRLFIITLFTDMVIRQGVVSLISPLLVARTLENQRRWPPTPPLCPISSKYVCLLLSACSTSCSPAIRTYKRNGSVSSSFSQRQVLTHPPILLRPDPLRSPHKVALIRSQVANH